MIRLLVSVLFFAPSCLLLCDQQPPRLTEIRRYASVRLHYAKMLRYKLVSLRLVKMLHYAVT